MIRGLQAYLLDRGLVQSCPLSALKDSRIGIDLTYYLKQLLSSPQTSEPLVAALGGQPIALISHIEADLRALDKHRIRPVFVVTGLPPNKKSRPFSYEDPRPKQRARAWDAYEAGNVQLAHQNLSTSNSLHYPDLYRAILRAFRHRNIEFIVAPYLSTGQLISLERHSKGYIHATYGPSELLLFDRVDKLITTLNLQDGNGSFQFVSKNAILADLRCSEEGFLDLGLLAGSDLCATFPALQDATFGPPPAHHGAPPNIRQINELLKQYKNGYTLALAFEQHPAVQRSQYVDQFCRARTMVKFCLVLSAEEGRVLPLPLATPPPPPPPPPPPLSSANPANGAGPAAGGGPVGATTGGAPILTAADVPVDLHDIFSQRLPDEVFLHVSRGLVGTSILTNLISGYVVEVPPLDNGETEDYKRFVREILTETPQSPRCVAIALACSALNGFWASRKVSAVYYFQPNADHAIAHESSATQQLISRVQHWNVPVRFVEEELRRQNSSTIDIALCLGATTSDALASRTKTPRTKLADGSMSQLEKKDEIVANVIWRMLELRGFLNHAHLHTPYARACHLALKRAKLNDKLQEPLYLALELIRGGVLHGNYYGGRTYSGGPSLGSAEDKQKTLVVMRALSILPMQFKAQQWTAPLSRELLVFNSFVKATGRAMRNLVEMIAMSMILRGEARRARDDYLDIALSLPFQHDTNTGLGIVVKCYLEALLTFHGAVSEEEEKSDKVREAKSSVIEMLVETFENVKDVKYELARGFRFWAALLTAVETLKAENSISADVAKQFEEADKWLKPMASLP